MILYLPLQRKFFMADFMRNVFLQPLCSQYGGSLGAENSSFAVKNEPEGRCARFRLVCISSASLKYVFSTCPVFLRYPIII